MSMELLRLGLQFFAGETKKEEDEEIKPGEEVVTGASGVTGSTTPAYKMPENTISAPVAQDFDTWYKANGGMDEAGYYAKYDLDPDRDYQNTVNTLNYDYQTSMATYGEQAEKMYQMGLQNSGVSDIFQANAFSSYLGNMNQAAADRITARKRNKAAFNDYVAGMRAQHGQYESGINTEYDTKLNSALAFALERYNGYNLDSVLSELGVAGYYTDIIEAVGDKLSGIDANSLAALKAQTENNLAQSILTAFPNLTEADRSAVETMFGGMVPADALDKAFNRALTTYQNTDAGRTAAVNTFVTNWTDSFDPNESKEAFVKKMITKDGTLDKSQRANAEAAWEQMKADFDNKVLEATEKAKAIWGGAVGAEGVPETARVINDLINEGYTEAVATAAVNAAGFTSGNAEYYTRTRAEELYAEAYSIMFGGGNIDLSKYGSADAFATAVKSKVADKLEKYALVGDKLDEIAKAKWQEAYDAKIWAGYDFIAKNIETMGKNAIDDYLKSSPNNFTKDMITAAWAKYNGSAEGENFTEMQNQTTVNELVTKWTDSFDTNESKETFVKKMITKEDGTLDESQRANAEAAWDQISSNYNTRMGEIDTLIFGLFRDDDGTSTWGDTPYQNADLNEFFTTQGLSEKEQQYVRDKLNTRKVNQETAVNQTVEDNLADIKQKNGLLTYGDYMNASSAAEGDSKTNYQNSATGLVKDVMNGKLDLSDADKYLTGFISSEGWDDLSEDEKRKKIVDAAIKDQNMTMKDKNEIVSRYVKTKTSEIIDTDTGNAKASGLADAGDLVTYIKGLELGSATEKELINDIIDQMGFEINDWQINWYGSVEGSEATIYSYRYDNSKPMTDTTVTDQFQKIYDAQAHDNGIIYHNGKLYCKANGKWYPIKEDGLTVVGDGHTNTPEQAKGIYNLLVVLYENNAKSVIRAAENAEMAEKIGTDSGYVQGELPSSTTVKPGGGAGEIKIKDDHKYLQSKTANPEGDTWQDKR